MFDGTCKTQYSHNVMHKAVLSFITNAALLFWKHVGNQLRKNQEKSANNNKQKDVYQIKLLRIAN